MKKLISSVCVCIVSVMLLVTSVGASPIPEVAPNDWSYDYIAEITYIFPEDDKPVTRAYLKNVKLHKSENNGTIYQ